MLTDFKMIQMQMGLFLRDPNNAPPPAGIESRRLKIYQELIYNNVENFVAGTFPVLRKLMDDESWHFWIRRFLIEHRCQSPLFTDISYEYLQFIEQQATESLPFPFYLELAHYEWVELALMTAEDEAPVIADLQVDYTKKALFSDNAWLLAYQYPVHKISPDFIPEQPGEQPSLLLVFRDQQDDIKFNLLAPGSFRMAQLLEQGDLTLEQVTEQLSLEMSVETNSIKLELEKSLHDWHEKGIIRGFQTD